MWTLPFVLESATLKSGILGDDHVFEASMV